MPESTPSDELVALQKVALAALFEMTPVNTIGEFLGTQDDGDGVVTLHFASESSGYPGWRWTVSISQQDGQEPSVLETELTPGDGALLAPDWVPWSDRLADYKAAQEPGDEDADDSDSDGIDDDDDDDAESDEDSDDDDDDDESDDEDDDAESEDDDDLSSDVLHGGDLDGVDIDEADPAIVADSDDDTDPDDDENDFDADESDDEDDDEREKNY